MRQVDVVQCLGDMFLGNGIDSLKFKNNLFVNNNICYIISNIVPLVINRQFLLTDIGNPHLLKFNA